MNKTLSKSLKVEKAIHDRIALQYKNVFNSLSLYRLGREKSINDICRLPIVKDSKILDIGCGTGEVLVGLKNKGFKSLHGVDISKEMIRIAKKSLPKSDLRVSSAHKLPYKNESMDAVCFVSVLHHFPKVLNPFKEAFRVLKPGGYLIINEPATNWYFENWPLKTGIERLLLMPLTALYLFLRTMNKTKVRQVETINNKDNYSVHHVHVVEEDLIKRVEEKFKVLLTKRREFITPVFSGVIFDTSIEQLVAKVISKLDDILFKKKKGLLLVIIAKK